MMMSSPRDMDMDMDTDNNTDSKSTKNSGTVDHEDVTYLYKLVPGVSERSFGFKVAQLAQVSCLSLPLSLSLSLCVTKSKKKNKQWPTEECNYKKFF